MRVFITGGAGFVGSNLTDRLLADGNTVTTYDNMSSGKEEYIRHHFSNNSFTFVKGELLDREDLRNSMKGHDFVFHLAANPDIRRSLTETDLDLNQGTIATHNVLEAMRLNGIKKIAFTSSSVVYGEPAVIPTPEDYGPLIPISLYGASKLACEGLVSSFCHIFGMQGWIFRFANIIGRRGTHGVVVDFIDKLSKSQEELEILGDGEQCKSFLHVDECVDAMLFAIEHTKEFVNIFNIGCGDNITIADVAKILVAEMGLNSTKFIFTGGIRGWPGDVPLMFLSNRKLKEMGWRSKYDSEDSVRKGIRDLIQENKKFQKKAE